MLRHLLLGRKVLTNLNSTFKSRDVTLPTMVSVVKAMVFPVVMFGCYSWTIKKAEGWRIDAFELWCWKKKTLESPLQARRSSQSILKAINSEYTLQELMLKLKLHLMWRTDSLEKILKQAKTEGRRKRGQQRMRWDEIRWFDGITEKTDMSLSSSNFTRRWWGTEEPRMLQSMRLQRVRHDLATEQQQTLSGKKHSR